jgi:hypothetical protein
LHFLPDALRLSKRLNSSSQDLRFTDNFKRQQEILMFWLLGAKAKNNVHKVNVFPSSLSESKKRHKTKNIVNISVMRHYLPRKHERSISLETILRSFRSLRSLPLLPLLLLNTFAAAAFYL